MVYVILFTDKLLTTQTSTQETGVLHHPSTFMMVIPPAGQDIWLKQVSFWLNLAAYVQP